MAVRERGGGPARRGRRAAGPGADGEARRFGRRGGRWAVADPGPDGGDGAGGRRELRGFGAVVGGGFLALGAAFTWLGHPPGPYLAGAGLLLLAAAVALPRALRPFRRAWMGLAEVGSRVVNAVLLTVVFFALVTPMGLLARLAGWDPLGRRGPDGTYWAEREDAGGEDRYLRPF